MPKLIIEVNFADAEMCEHNRHKVVAAAEDAVQQLADEEDVEDAEQIATIDWDVE